MTEHYAFTNSRERRVGVYAAPKGTPIESWPEIPWRWLCTESEFDEWPKLDYSVYIHATYRPTLRETISFNEVTAIHEEREVQKLRDDNEALRNQNIYATRMNEQLLEANVALIQRTLSGLTVRVDKWIDTLGWREEHETRTVGDAIALLHSECSEALEAWRDYHDYEMHEGVAKDGGPKPVGMPAEFADVLIRLIGMCSHYGIDLEEAFNTVLAYAHTREYQHGGRTL